MAGEAFDADVLIVGLGPVGAVLTALLVQKGISTIVLERDVEVYPLPRAVHFDHEIMRLFQQLRVAEIVGREARTVPAYEFRSADGRVLMRLPPARETPSAWDSGYMFHQPSLEHALRNILAASPDADVRLGWRFESLTQDADGVSAQASGPRGRETIRTRFLVGCDGASSPVRDTIGGGLSDYQFDEPWLVIDVRVLPGARMPDVNLQICDPARPTTCVLGGPGRHRWEFMLLPGETPEAMLGDETVGALIAPWGCGPVEIERKAVYRFHGLVAERWRDRRVLIAGDAAHQTPPFAGQGMCSGLRDAADLAWKLAAVLSGRGGERLLDTYQVEREPNVRSYIELAIGMGRIVCTLDPVAAAARDADMIARQEAGAPALPPLRPARMAAGCLLAGSPAAGEFFPQPAAGEGAGRVRMDDALGAGPWLIDRGPGGPTTPTISSFGLDSPPLAPFRAALAAWLDARGVEAVLVRPDRHVFGAGEPGVLLAAWAEQLASAGAAR
jgi:3-(3-hydroxy-phenyl)propionate hydroxylase